MSNRSPKISLLLGSSTIGASPCQTPRILDLGECAQPKPAFEALAEIASALDFDGAGIHGGLHREVTHPDSCHSSQVGCYIETDFKSVISETKIDLQAIAHEPPVALRGWLIGKSKLYGERACRKCRRLYTAAHVPHQKAHVQLIAAKFGTEPAMAPFA